MLCAGSTTERGHEGGWLLDIGASASAQPYRWVEDRYRLEPDLVALS